MENKNGLSDNLRSISILYTALISGILLFTGLSLGINKINGPFLYNPEFSQIFLVGVVVLTVICLFLAHSNYNKKMRPELQIMKPLNEKFNNYRSALIKYMAFLEGPAMLSIIGFLLTGYFRFIAITLIILLNMLLKRPSKTRLSNELQLNSNEQSEL